MSYSTSDVAEGRANEDGLELTNINVLPVDKNKASQKVRSDTTAQTDQS